jgi:hypothetical protein
MQNLSLLKSLAVTALLSLQPIRRTLFELKTR